MPWLAINDHRFARNLRPAIAVAGFFYQILFNPETRPHEYSHRKVAEIYADDERLRIERKICVVREKKGEKKENTSLSRSKHKTVEKKRKRISRAIFRRYFIVRYTACRITLHSRSKFSSKSSNIVVSSSFFRLSKSSRCREITFRSTLNPVTSFNP